MTGTESFRRLADEMAAECTWWSPGERQAFARTVEKIAKMAMQHGPEVMLDPERSARVSIELARHVWTEAKNFGWGEGGTP